MANTTSQDGNLLDAATWDGALPTGDATVLHNCTLTDGQNFAHNLTINPDTGYLTTTGTCTITGNVSIATKNADVSTSEGILVYSGSLTITGSVTGGAGQSGGNAGTGYAGASAVAIRSTSNAHLHVGGNANGASGGSNNGAAGGHGIVSVDGAVVLVDGNAYGAGGQSGTSGGNGGSGSTYIDGSTENGSYGGDGGSGGTSGDGVMGAGTITISGVAFGGNGGGAGDGGNGGQGGGGNGANSGPGGSGGGGGHGGNGANGGTGLSATGTWSVAGAVGGTNANGGHGGSGGNGGDNWSYPGGTGGSGGTAGNGGAGGQGVYGSGTGTGGSTASHGGAPASNGDSGNAGGAGMDYSGGMTSSSGGGAGGGGLAGGWSHGYVNLGTTTVAGELQSRAIENNGMIITTGAITGTDAVLIVGGHWSHYGTFAGGTFSGSLWYEGLKTFGSGDTFFLITDVAVTFHNWVVTNSGKIFINVSNATLSGTNTIENQTTAAQAICLDDASAITVTSAVVEGIPVEDIVAAQYVLTGHSNYAGGDAGTLMVPTAGNVSTANGDYGVGGSGTTPTLDLTNLSAGNVKDGVTIGGVEGTYDPMAAAVFPAASNVEVAETAYGPTGTEYAGSLDLAAAESAAAGPNSTPTRPQLRPQWPTSSIRQRSSGSPVRCQQAPSWWPHGGTYVDPANADVKVGVAVGVSPRVGTLNASTFFTAGSASAADLRSGKTVGDVVRHAESGIRQPGGVRCAVWRVGRQHHRDVPCPRSGRRSRRDRCRRHNRDAGRSRGDGCSLRDGRGCGDWCLRCPNPPTMFDLALWWTTRLEPWPCRPQPRCSVVWRSMPPRARGLPRRPPRFWPASISGLPSALTGTLAVTVTGSTPVTEGGLLTIVKGDDYTVETVQPIEFTDDGTWPDLTGATVVLYVRQKDNLAYTPELQVTGSLVDDDPKQIIRFEPLKADTARMVAGENADTYAVRATLASGQVRTLIVDGLCTVSD